MITNVADSFQFIITFTFITSEVNSFRHSVNIYFKSGPISVTENTGIMRQRKMCSLRSRQMIFQERDPLCWVLLWLVCYGRRVLGWLDIICSQGFGEADEAALHATSAGLICWAEGGRHRGGEREARGEVKAVCCRMGWGLSPSLCKAEIKLLSSHDGRSGYILFEDTGVGRWRGAEQGQHHGAGVGGKEVSPHSVFNMKVQTRLSGSSWPLRSSRWLSIWDHNRIEVRVACKREPLGQAL